ncbi:MAG TPA: dihydrolipoamide acetyltransferase family protein [Streptosporangiaceae bacterium]|nr:dihydrolipoamide acetyltransferase family protein [Streptosporangiaceae bacterium]
MAELKQFKLPDVGEGLTEADIVRWHVRPGDEITVNQIIVEIETAKAVVELPSPYAGVVADLLVPEGETADVGTPIISVQVGAGPVAGASEIPAPPAEGAVEPGIYGSPAPKEERQAVLVGYGVKLGTTKRRARKPMATTPPATTPPATTPQRPPAVPPSSRAHQPVNGLAGGAPPLAGTVAGPGTAVLAKPPVRKLAKDLGVDLAGLTGTGPAGSITREDVQAAAAGLTAGDLAGHLAEAGTAVIARTGTARVSALPREERIPIRGVRKHTAAAMAASAFTAPHVTEFLQIDITETMTAAARLKSLPDFDGLRVSPLLLVAKALLIAAARYPMVNSAWDEAAQEIVVRHYVNLGIAAATDRGLIVPNVKDADAMSLPDLARAIADLAGTARAGKSTPADLRGGTITITNVGIFGVDTGTPIISPGEAAILAFGQVKDAPWVHEGQLAVRKVCTLALSFDHRIVDGDLGSAVLREVGAMLTDPLRMLAWS